MLFTVVMLLSVNIYSQFERYDTTTYHNEEKEDKYINYTPGLYLEDAANNLNTSIIILGVGAGISLLGLTDAENYSTYAAVGAACEIISLIIYINGISEMKKAGRKLHEYHNQYLESINLQGTQNGIGIVLSFR